MFYLVLLSFYLVWNGFYLVLLAFVGLYLVLNGFHLVLLGFYELLPSFSGLYWIFNLFYLVLPSFTGFCRVLIRISLRSSQVGHRGDLDADGSLPAGHRRQSADIKTGHSSRRILEIKKNSKKKTHAKLGRNPVKLLGSQSSFIRLVSNLLVEEMRETTLFFFSRKNPVTTERKTR